MVSLGIFLGLPSEVLGISFAKLQSVSLTLMSNQFIPSSLSQNTFTFTSLIDCTIMMIVIDALFSDFLSGLLKQRRQTFR